MTKLNTILKSRDITLLTKMHIIKSVVFPVVMYGCEKWTIKNAEGIRIDAFKLWCWRRLLRVSDSKESKCISPKRNQFWIFIGRKNPEAKALILWPPDANTQLIGKDPDARKDWGHNEKGTTEDEMVGWHHRLNGHELEPTPGDSERQGSLACCSPWGHKESDTTEKLDKDHNKSRYWWYVMYNKLTTE